MATTQVIETCTRCGEECVLGVNATFEHKQVVCDDCSGVIRVANGYAIDREPHCTGVDPLRCDDLHCPIHGRV